MKKGKEMKTIFRKNLHSNNRCRDSELMPLFNTRHCYFKGKENYQQITPGNLNLLLSQVRHTDNSKMNFVAVGVCQPGGTVIIFPES